MGETSKNTIMVLALVVIVVSAIGTWSVLNAAIDVFSGEQIPVVSQPSVNRATVRVNVNGEPAEATSEPATGFVSGKLTVMVRD